MASVAAAERSALCDLFLEVGPDAPTLAGSWTTRDLAAHLVIRERRPDGAAGIAVGPLAGYGDRVRRAEAERPWSEIVARVRKGPPVWSPARLDAVNDLVNTIEFFVHHEDVRRARQPWTARRLSPELEDVLAGNIAKLGRLLARKAPVGVILESPGRSPIRLRAAEPAATIAGPIGECVLYVYGRTTVADVAVTGSPDAVAAVRRHSFGF